MTWLIAKCVCGTLTSQRIEILLSACRIMVTVIEWPTLLIQYDSVGGGGGYTQHQECTSRSTPDVRWLS